MAKHCKCRETEERKAPFKKKILFIDFREKGGKRERQRPPFVVSLVYAFIG